MVQAPKDDLHPDGVPQQRFEPHRLRIHEQELQGVVQEVCLLLPEQQQEHIVWGEGGQEEDNQGAMVVEQGAEQQPLHQSGKNSFKNAWTWKKSFFFGWRGLIALVSISKLATT